jgi:hypothetical protein
MPLNRPRGELFGTLEILNSGGATLTVRVSEKKNSTLKWVLPTTLRVYGLRPSGKTKGSTRRDLRDSEIDTVIRGNTR